MRVLVTGGAGYIGSHTILRLLQAGHDVVSVDNYSNSSPESLRRVRDLADRDFVAARIDCCDRRALAEVFSRHAIDAVIHFAALKAVGESTKIPLRYYTTNLGSLTNLVSIMGEAGCHRLVFSSSATVYGYASSPPFPETAPLQATNPYGRTKLFAEDLLRDVAAADSRWRIALLRYFNPVGAHESGQIGESPLGIPNNLMPYVAPRRTEPACVTTSTCAISPMAMSPRSMPSRRWWEPSRSTWAQVGDTASWRWCGPSRRRRAGMCRIGSHPAARATSPPAWPTRGKLTSCSAGEHDWILQPCARTPGGGSRRIRWVFTKPPRHSDR